MTALKLVSQGIIVQNQSDVLAIRESGADSKPYNREGTSTFCISY